MNTFDAYIKYVPQTLFGINFCLQTAAMESMEKIGVFILSAEAAPLVEELIGASKNVGELYDFLENLHACKHSQVFHGYLLGEEAHLEGFKTILLYTI